MEKEKEQEFTSFVVLKFNPGQGCGGKKAQQRESLNITQAERYGDKAAFRTEFNTGTGNRLSTLHDFLPNFMLRKIFKKVLTKEIGFDKIPIC